MLAVVVAVLIAYDYDCARTLWASRPFGGEAGLARRESLQLRPRWPNIEPQMIGQKEEKKSWVARPVSGTNQRPPKPALNRAIGKGASKNWPRFWGQIWCCKRVFSVCMCSLKWIRGACICPASWPGVKNTIAVSRSWCAIVAKNYCSMSAMVISAAYSAACFLLCTMRAHSHEARNACFWDPKNRPHVGHVCQSLGFAHKIQCVELKPARPGTGDHE